MAWLRLRAVRASGDLTLARQNTNASPTDRSATSRLDLGTRSMLLGDFTELYLGAAHGGAGADLDDSCVAFPTARFKPPAPPLRLHLGQRLLIMANGLGVGFR